MKSWLLVDISSKKIGYLGHNSTGTTDGNSLQWNEADDDDKNYQWHMAAPQLLSLTLFNLTIQLKYYDLSNTFSTTKSQQINTVVNKLNLEQSNILSIKIYKTKLIDVKTNRLQRIIAGLLT